MKPEPLTLIWAPAAAAGGDKLPIAGPLTVKIWLALLGTEFTVTVTGPDVTLLGATAVIELPFQTVIEAGGAPLKDTVLLPCVLPKFDPEIWTDVPDTPDDGVKLVTLGVGIKVNELFELRVPSRLTETLRLPGVRFEGTTTVNEVEVQLTGFTEIPAKNTVVVSYWSPKLVPVMVRVVPATPELGEIFVIVGVAGIVKL